MSGAPILRLRGITKTFGKVEVLRGVDLDVHVGVRHLLIGPNGAGKTTLFNVINGHFPPTAGSIEFDGGDITRLPVARRARSGLGRTFQVASLFPHLTVWENLLIAAQAPSLLRKGSRAVGHDADTALEQSGLAGQRRPGRRRGRSRGVGAGACCAPSCLGAAHEPGSVRAHAG